MQYVVHGSWLLTSVSLTHQYRSITTNIRYPGRGAGSGEAQTYYSKDTEDYRTVPCVVRTEPRNGATCSEITPESSTARDGKSEAVGSTPLAEVQSFQESTEVRLFHRHFDVGRPHHSPGVQGIAFHTLTGTCQL